MSNSEPIQRTVITGSSTGFGLLTAKLLLTLGYDVVATMRDSTTRNASKAEQLRSFSTNTSGELRVVELDVTSHTSVASAAEQIQQLGQVDVLVNNAGVMNVGVTEAYSIDEVKAQFEINTFGPARVAEAFMPQMREQRSGLIINVSSVLGRLNLPFFGVYCASKFALEALFEAYRYELAGFGVDCVIVEPGPYGSELLANSPAPKDQSVLDAYGELAAIPGSGEGKLSADLRRAEPAAKRGRLGRDRAPYPAEGTPPPANRRGGGGHGLRSGTPQPRGQRDPECRIEGPELRRHDLMDRAPQSTGTTTVRSVPNGRRVSGPENGPAKQ
jgi:NAD(P)-dependent dehydrogenase (short-subunit alcohol dehydrogenase family)